MGRKIDCVHHGSCVMSACLRAKCPIDLGKMKSMLESKFNVQVVAGTHAY